jgi:hypothetical protein
VYTESQSQHRTKKHVDLRKQSDKSCQDSSAHI